MFPVLVRKEEREEERSICHNKRQDKATARLTVDGASRFAPRAEKQVSAARVVFDQQADNYNVREKSARLAT